ncbi:unnamed protein product, partial [Urochloa humidicola]
IYHNPYLCIPLSALSCDHVALSYGSCDLQRTERIQALPTEVNIWILQASPSSSSTRCRRRASAYRRPHLRLVQLRRQPPPPHRPTRLRRAEIEERVCDSERQRLLLRYLRDSHTSPCSSPAGSSSGSSPFSAAADATLPRENPRSQTQKELLPRDEVRRCPRVLRQPATLFGDDHAVRLCYVNDVLEDPAALADAEEIFPDYFINVLRYDCVGSSCFELREDADMFSLPDHEGAACPADDSKV